MEKPHTDSMNQEGPTFSPPSLPDGWLGQCHWSGLKTLHTDIDAHKLSGRVPAANSTTSSEPQVILNGEPPKSGNNIVYFLTVSPQGGAYRASIIRSHS